MPRGQEEGCRWTEILGTPGHSENELKMATIRRAQKQKELTSKWVMTTTFFEKDGVRLSAEEECGSYSGWTFSGSILVFVIWFHQRQE